MWNHCQVVVCTDTSAVLVLCPYPVTLLPLLTTKQVISIGAIVDIGAGVGYQVISSV